MDNLVTIRSLKPHVNPPPKGSTPSCAAKQSKKIADQLIIPMDASLYRNNTPFFRQKFMMHPEPEWLESFYEEEADIESNRFLGLIVNCNKGHDAIRAERMGISSEDFDAVKWKNTIQSESGGFCHEDNFHQAKLVHPKRESEMHCIEPMSTTFAVLKMQVTLWAWSKMVLLLKMLQFPPRMEG